MKADTRERRAQDPDELDPRSRQILRAVIREYVESGEPVASGVLAGHHGIALSPASVRSVLADLEALGYLDKPHTSAGRVPTEKGFRFYVDVLVRLRPIGGRDKELIDQRLDPLRGLASAEVMVADTSRLLHSLTRHAGLASTPKEEETFRSIQFLRVGEGRVLAVCLTGTGAVRNRLLLVEFPVDQDELDRASAYLSELLGAGSTLREVRAALARELHSERALYDRLCGRALVLGARALGGDDERSPGVVVEGEASLLSEPTLAESVEKLRAIFRALEEKERLLRLLERAAESGAPTLFIGAETGLAGAERLALVASPYGRGGDRLGAVGVIGPARMVYARVIPIVEYAARALSRTLAVS